MTLLAYIGLGSNIEPERNLPRAVRLMAEQCEIIAASSVWETAPVGFTSQAHFLNAVACIRAALAPHEIKQQVLAQIEFTLGRVRTANRNGPRSIDLDLLLYGDEIIHDHGLRIPDPDILIRPFVAGPLAELAPETLHPVTGQTFKEIAEGLTAEQFTMIPRPEITLWP